MNLREILVRPIRPSEERHYQDLMRQHHYLGALPKIGETLWYVAACRDEWVALLSFSASAWKCTARDHWIGWDFRFQYGRLKLIVNNSRFLILTDWRIPNLGSRVLALCQKRLCKDWEKTFGHPVVLLETFVDPQRYRGTVYKADNWVYVGDTKGFRRTTRGYSATSQSPKMVFVKPLKADARELLCRTILPAPYSLGDSKTMLNADQMRSLPAFFKGIPDPRRAQGRRHRLNTVLAIAAGAVLCGMRGYKAISDWADSLSQKARERFNCRREKGRYVVPSESISLMLDKHSSSSVTAWRKKTGKISLDVAYGITSRTPEQADPQHVLKVNREHWTIENSCHYIIDWNYDEDRSRIRKGYGPENITRLRRFAIGVIKSKGVRSVAQKMRQLTRNTRLVFDYLRMTENSCACPSRN